MPRIAVELPGLGHERPKDPIGQLVWDLCEQGKPSLGWVVEWTERAKGQHTEDPILAAWYASKDPFAMFYLLFGYEKQSFFTELYPGTWKPPWDPEDFYATSLFMMKRELLITGFPEGAMPGPDIVRHYFSPINLDSLMELIRRRK